MMAISEIFMRTKLLQFSNITLQIISFRTPIFKHSTTDYFIQDANFHTLHYILFYARRQFSHIPLHTILFRAPIFKHSTTGYISFRTPIFNHSTTDYFIQDANFQIFHYRLFYLGRQFSNIPLHTILFRTSIFKHFTTNYFIQVANFQIFHYKLFYLGRQFSNIPLQTILFRMPIFKHSNTTDYLNQDANFHFNNVVPLRNAYTIFSPV